MDDAVRRLSVWHQDEIKRLTGMLTDLTQDDDEPAVHLSNGTTQQRRCNVYSPLSSWDGGNDTAPVSPAPLSPDMFAPQTAWPTHEVPETQMLPRQSTFVDFLDTLASEEDEPTQ